MARISFTSTNTARWLLAALFAVNVYRAVTQSFTTDEAFTYNDFVEPWIGKMAQRYDANNHVLNSLLAKLSTTLFGLSEFTVRLPSVLAGGLYLLVVYRLCRRLFDRGALFLAALALLALNPLLLDFLSAARGYGMALAFWLASVLLMLESLDESGSRRLYPAGLLLALAVAANLTILIPAAAFALVFVVGMLVRKRAAAIDLVEQFLLPAAVLDFVLLLLPLQHAESGQFYVGTRILAQALDSLIAPALFHDYNHPALFGFPVNPVGVAPIWYPVFYALVLLVLGAAVAALRVAGRAGQGIADRALLLFVPATLLALGLLVAGHRFAGMPYPTGRTGLYWIPLLSLVALLALRHFDLAVVKAAGLFLAGALTVQYLCQFTVTVYSDWLDDAGVKRLALELREQTGNRPLRIAASWPEHYVLDFYRRRLQMTRWQRVVRTDSDAAAGCDYYLLAPDDASPIALKARELHRLARAGPLLLVGR